MELLKEIKEVITFGFLSFLFLFGISVAISIPIIIMMIIAMYMDGTI